MARTVVEAAESLLDQEIPVLDKGFVRLVDYMGGDERIVSSARVKAANVFASQTSAPARK